MFIRVNNSTMAIEEMSTEPKGAGWIETDAALPNVECPIPGGQIRYYYSNGNISHDVSAPVGSDLLSIITQLIESDRQKERQAAQDELTLELLESGVL